MERGILFLIIHARAPLKEKIQVLTEVLKRFPLGDIYIRPVIRELLGESKD